MKEVFHKNHQYLVFQHILEYLEVHEDGEKREEEEMKKGERKGERKGRDI